MMIGLGDMGGGGGGYLLGDEGKRKVVHPPLLVCVFGNNKAAKLERLKDLAADARTALLQLGYLFRVVVEVDDGGNVVHHSRVK